MSKNYDSNMPRKGKYSAIAAGLIGLTSLVGGCSTDSSIISFGDRPNYPVRAPQVQRQRWYKIEFCEDKNLFQLKDEGTGEYVPNFSSATREGIVKKAANAGMYVSSRGEWARKSIITPITTDMETLEVAVVKSATNDIPDAALVRPGCEPDSQYAQVTVDETPDESPIEEPRAPPQPDVYDSSKSRSKTSGEDEPEDYPRGERIDDSSSEPEPDYILEPPAPPVEPTTPEKLSSETYVRAPVRKGKNGGYFAVINSEGDVISGRNMDDFKYQARLHNYVPVLDRGEIVFVGPENMEEGYHDGPAPNVAPKRRVKKTDLETVVIEPFAGASNGGAEGGVALRVPVGPEGRSTKKEKKHKRAWWAWIFPEAGKYYWINHPVSTTFSLLAKLGAVWGGVELLKDKDGHDDNYQELAQEEEQPAPKRKDRHDDDDDDEPTNPDDFDWGTGGPVGK